MTKNILESWTFWYGFAQMLLGGLGLVSGLMDHTQALTLVITGIGTIGFRLKTTTPINVSQN